MANRDQDIKYNGLEMKTRTRMDLVRPHDK